MITLPEPTLPNPSEGIKTGRPVPTLPNPNVGIKTGRPVRPEEMADFLNGIWPGTRRRVRRLRLPRLPRLLDADDAHMLARLVVYSLLLIWVAVVLAVALGFAVRLFLLAKGG